MPTLQEQVAAATAKVDALLPQPTEKTVQLSPADAMARVVGELQKGATPERAKYLAGVLAEINKVNSEGTNTSIKIKEVNSPEQIKPETVAIATLQTLTSGKPDSLFATNLHTVIGKAELIQKLLIDRDREPLSKGAMSDKLDEIVDMFGLSKEDLNSECDLRWKVGDLIYMLQQQAKLERMVVKADPVTKSDPPMQEIWPSDMAGAKFDPVAKNYERRELPWGYDKSADASRR